MENLFFLFFKLLSGALIGGIVGSFITMLIYRLPRGLSIIHPASHCVACQTPLAPRDLIPVVSYFVNHGKCRFCGTPYGQFHVWVETALCISGALIVWFLLS